MTQDSPTVLILGGGLAGLAAGVALAARGCRITLLESRGRLGGRASSFTDATSGQLIDTCQHVSMGCCTNFAHFCATVGVGRLLQPQRALYFMTPDRRISPMAAAPWPAPLHLAPSFLRAHYLTPIEKARIAWGMACLRLARTDDDPPFLDWLQRHGQTPRTIDRFWGLVLTSALNEGIDRLGLRYARKVFVDGFLTHPRGFQVELPTAPLGEFYGERLQRWFTIRGARLLLNQAVRAIHVVEGMVDKIETREGEHLKADAYIAALPFERLLDFLPANVIDTHVVFANLRKLETSPITSAHLWYRQDVMPLPHVVLVDCLGQWVFKRGMLGDGEHYLQVVVSAARQFRGMGNEEVLRTIAAEVEQLFPAAKGALLRGRVVTEHAATFSAVPGVDRWRPAQATPLPNLFLAGDYTATGWPATMEGAVRSGYLAAEALLARLGRPCRVVRPDLR
jgi:squalene-associated FAD-dependent desaturase